MCVSSPLNTVCLRLRAEKGKPCPAIPTGCVTPSLLSLVMEATAPTGEKEGCTAPGTELKSSLTLPWILYFREVSPARNLGVTPPSFLRLQMYSVSLQGCLNLLPPQASLLTKFFWELLSSLPTINFFPLSILEYYKIWFFYKDTLAMVCPCLKFCNCPPPSER